MKMQPWCERHHRALVPDDPSDTDCLRVVKEKIEGTILEIDTLQWDLRHWYCPDNYERGDQELEEFNECADNWIIKVSGFTMAGPQMEKYLLSGKEV